MSCYAHSLHQTIFLRADPDSRNDVSALYYCCIDARARGALFARYAHNCLLNVILVANG
jgi:hypothetical protein